jgi:hypothetical protein
LTAPRLMADYPGQNAIRSPPSLDRGRLKETRPAIIKPVQNNPDYRHPASRKNNPSVL